MKKPCILIMTGGTGGHVFPALAVGRYLLKQGWAVHWLGTKQGLESQIISKTEIPLHYITIQGLRKRGLWGWVVAPFRLMKAVYQAILILQKLKPTVVFGGGGFVSGPGGFAAWLLRYPLIVHEQNSIIGLTNRLLSLVANTTLESFPNSFPKNRHAIFTGNPIREELLNLPEFSKRNNRSDQLIKLLVLGGSRGAMALNSVCPEALQILPVEKRPLIWHQTGDKHFEFTQKQYLEAGIEARIEPFIDNMAEAYAWADLVLCRAGAMTIGELAVVGVGSILVPYPYAVDDHQTKNARFLADEGAAYLIAQSDLTKEKLANLLLDFSNDHNKLLKMASAAAVLGKKDALQQVARFCEEIKNAG